MPDHGSGRCDGHHEMVDSIKGPRSRPPAHEGAYPRARLHRAPCLAAGFRVAARKGDGEPGMPTLNT
jgi:hypothetical protein